MGACCVKEEEDQNLGAQKNRRQTEQELPSNQMQSMETAQSNVGNDIIQ